MESWKHDITGLERIEPKICIKPGDFGKRVYISMNSFLDAPRLWRKHLSDAGQSIWKHTLHLYDG